MRSERRLRRLESEMVSAPEAVLTIVETIVTHRDEVRRAPAEPLPCPVDGVYTKLQFTREG